MTPDPFRTALAQHHGAIKASAARAGYSERVGNLLVRLEDLLVCAESRRRDAREAADEGNHAMAVRHHRKAGEYIASARAVIALPGGREAHRLYQERIGQ